MSTEEEYQVIDIKKIKPSPRNYRRSMDKQAFEELVGSVLAKGILQPILVRPVKGNGSFEIVAGHRRHKAAGQAGIAELPAIVRDLTDEEALEIQVIENTLREDPNPMDEALGFQELIKIGKHTSDTLAVKLDKSVSYVERRLRLLNLPTPVQDKIVSGEISIGHALLITRLKNTGDQKKFLKMITEDEISVKEAQQRISQYSTDIKDAIFNIDKCNVCPYLTSNQVKIFPELNKTGKCMDRSCYRTKTQGHYNAIIKARKKDGFKIITDQGKAENHQSWSSGPLCFIIAPGAKDRHGAIKPKRYKSECMKCFKLHAFYLYTEKPRYSGDTSKRICFGEICLDKKCLYKMNKIGSGNDSSSSASGSTGAGDRNQINPMNFRACRDRFLRTSLPTVAEKNTTLATRLLIYHLLKSVGPFRGSSQIIKKHYPDFRGFASWGNDYHFIREIDVKELAGVLQKLLIAAISVTEPETLLLMTDEAGVDMKKDFPVDKDFLQTLTKVPLLKFIKDFKLSLDVTDKDKKGDIIKAILTQELRGKLPAEVIEEIEPEEVDYDDEAFCVKCSASDNEVKGELNDKDEFVCNKCKGGKKE